MRGNRFVLKDLVHIQNHTNFIFNAFKSNQKISLFKLGRYTLGKSIFFEKKKILICLAA